MAQQKPESGSAVVTKSEPGKVAAAQVTKVTATVEAIDQTKRQVTLKGPKGNSLVLPVSPEAKNFDQVKVGDKVVVGYIEALSMTLKKGGKELRSKTDTTDAARAATGSQPGGAALRQVTVIADVTAINAKTHTVTLKGPEQTVDLKVRDPEQFKLVKVGDQIEAVYSEALALTVEPVKPAKK
jgi:Cu/Ag efflux protein CusF